MTPLLHRRPADLERWRGRHLQLAAIAATAPLRAMHYALADFYREQIAAIIVRGD